MKKPSKEEKQRRFALHFVNAVTAPQGFRIVESALIDDGRWVAMRPNKYDPQWSIVVPVGDTPKVHALIATMEAEAEKAASAAGVGE